MKVLLVKPPSPFPTQIPPLGLGYLATALRREGHKVLIADCPREGLNPPQLLRLIADWEPGLVGFQAFSADLPALQEISRGIRTRFPNLTMVLGGPHPSCLPQHCFAFIPEVDFVIQGEAETGLPRLVSALVEGGTDLATVPGLAFRQEDTLIVNPPHFEEDLDSLGPPSWDLLKPEIQAISPHGAFVRRLPVAPQVTTRGCPFPCTFCAARRISGQPVRARSPENVLDEIAFLIKYHGIKEIHFEDDNFTFHRDFAAAVCEGILQRGLDISWCCPNGVRLDTLDTELLALMKRSGCYSISIGIESGSDNVLKRIRKRLDTVRIRTQVELVHRAGIKTTGFFIIGFPDETEKEIQETISFARSLPLDRAQFSTFLPLPGTPPFDDYLKGKTLDDVPWADFFTTEVIWPPEGLSRKRMLALQRQAFLSFYLRPRILAGVIREIRSPRHFLHLLRRVVAVVK